MSTTIDQKVVQMQFDNSNFERNVSNSLSTLDKLKKALKFDGASKGLEDIQSSANKVNFSGLTNGIDTVNARFSYLQASIQHQLNNIVDSAVNAEKRIVSALTIDPIKTGFQEYETQINAVQTILANTQHNGTTLDEVNSALDALNTYADKTIYNFTEMTRNIGTFTAAGVDLQTSVDSIQGIANLAAVSGSTSQQASTAMYQLSQALAAGKVSLMDWNSVVNAGMGGKVFQDALIRTSELLGTGAEKAIKTAGSFRESLTKSGWLTTEVLTETLSQFAGAYSEAELISQGFTKSQAKEIANMAVTAQDAATKVKTFTQLWDTLQEAAQSGWTQTWELLVGDFEESKGLLTTISDTVGDIINKSSESRNNLLGEALNSPWKKLIEGVNEAGIETDAFQSKVEKLYDTAKGEGSFDKVVEKYGSFEKACREGAISTGLLKKSITELNGKVIDLSNIKKNLKIGDNGKDIKKVQEALRSLNYDVGKASADGIFGKVTEEAIKSFQKDHDLKVTGIVDEKTIAALEEASSSAKTLNDNLDGLLGNLDNLGGREKLIESFKNIWESLLAIIKPIKKAFSEIFPPATAEQLSSLIDKFHSLTSKMTVSGEASKNIYNAFKGVFSILSIGVNILKTIGSSFISIVTSLFGFSGFILDGAGALGKWLSNGANAVKENNILVAGINAITNILKSAITKIQEFGKSLKESFKTPDAGGIFGFFTSLWNTITKIGSSIGKTIKSITSTIAEAFGKGDIFEVINSGLIAGIFLGIKKLTGTADEQISSIGDIFKNLAGLMDGIIGNVKGILDDTRDALKAYQDQLKANTLIKIASAIAILAGSIFIISTIDAEKLAQSLGAIAVLFAELLGSLAIFDKMSGKFKGTMKAIPLMIALSTAILILASAMKSISGISWEGIGKGLAAIGALMLELSIFLRTAKFEGKMTKTALGIVLLSASMIILSTAVKNFGSMQWEEIGKGLAAIGVLLLEISLFTNLTGNAKKVLSTGAAMVLLGASMKMFASAMKDFGSMQFEEIKRGLTAMGGALAEVIIAMKLMPKGSIINSTGLIVAATSLLMLSNVLSKFGNMSWGEIGKGLIVMGGALAELAIGLNLMKGTLKGSTSLLIASASLAIITPVIKTLGDLSWGQIGKGLVALAGAFTVIGIAGALLSPIVPAILGLSAAFLILGVGMAGIGAGLVLVGIGITSLAASLATGATSIVAGLSAIVLGLLKLVPEIAKIIGTTILEVAAILGDYAPQLAESLCKLLVGVVDSLATYAPQLVNSLLDLLINVINGLAEHIPQLIEAFSNLFEKIFGGVAKALNNADSDSLLKGIAAIGLMAIIARLLSGLMSILPSAMLGLVAVGVLIAELAFVLAAVGQLNKIPGLEDSIDKAGELLNRMGNAIGKFISGIDKGITSDLSEIGQNIADFMDKLAIASDNASGIKSESFSGVSKLIEALSGIGLVTVGTSISDIFTLGGTSMEKFETDGVAFFNAMKEISKASIGVTVDEASMSAVIGIATELATLQSSLEPIGGVISWFTGRDDLGTFGVNVGQFIGSIITAFEKLNGFTFDTEALKTIITGSTELASLQSSLEPIGGVISWFSGRDDLGTFGKNTGSFISSMTTALGTLENVKFNQKSFDAIIAAATKLSELQSSLEPIGGVISWFNGRDDLATFGGNVGQFILSMKIALTSLEGVTVNQKALTAIIESATSLSKLQSSLEPIGGVITWFSGRDDLGTFGVNVGKFINSMVAAFSNLEYITINEEAIGSIINAATKLATLQSSLENIGGVIDWFTGRDDLGTFGVNAGSFISSMAIAFADLGDTTINEEAIASIINAATKLADLQSSLENVGGVIDWFTGRDDLGTFGTNIATFADAMSKLKTGMGEDGIPETVVTSVTNACNALLALNDSLPEEGFFDSKITMTEFSTYISNFSDAISNFSTKASTINSEAINVAISAANRIRTLISTIADLDTSGIATFTGVGTGGFGADGAAYKIAQAMAAFSEKVAGIDTAAVSTSVSSALQIRTLIAGLVGLDYSGIESFKPQSIGSAMKSYSDKVAGIEPSIVSKSISAANRLRTFISSLSGLDTSGIGNFRISSIGSSLKAYAGSVSGMDASTVSASISAANRLKNFISSLAGIDTSGVDKFKSAVSSLGKVNIGDAASSLRQSASKLSSVGTDMVSSLAKGMTSSSSKVTSSTTKIVSDMLKTITNKASSFQQAGVTTMTKFINGISSKKMSLSTAVMSSVSTAASRIKGQFSTFYSSGKYLGEGLVLGINAKQSAAWTAGYNLGKAAVDGEKAGQKSNSPSKLTIQAGKWLGEGLVIGIGKMTSSVYKAGYNLGDSAVGTISSSIAKISEYVSNGIDAEPTIRPIMDLSDIESGVGALDGMLGQDLTFGASARVSSISSTMNGRNQNGVNSDVVSAINKLSKQLSGIGNTTYNVNGITYDDGSNISDAVKSIVRAARIERRV